MRLVRSSRGVIAFTSALTVALVAGGNAHADTKRISDGNDRPGRLDIRSASHGHSGARVVHTISTFGRWPTRLLGPNTPNLFAVEISTDGDRRLERVVLVFFQNGRMVAGVFRVRSGGRLVFIGRASASKPNARSVRVSIRRSRLGDPVGYRWNAYSQFGSAASGCNLCIDRAPNSRRVLHDITPPRIVLTSFPAIPPDVEYDVTFRVSDRGGAGLRRWRLQHRLLGDPTWDTVASGTTGGLQSYHRVSAENDDDQFRVVAVDRHGNRHISRTRLVSVPIDDRSADLVYNPPWTPGGESGDFRGTRSTSANASDTMEYTFTGRYVAWVAPGGGNGEASVMIDGVPAGDRILANFSGPRRIVFQQSFASVDTHTITITVTGGTVPIDGIIVR
jgi:hypothetical protein